MKYLLIILFFLLPFHAFLITYLKCKVWIDTNLIRFWKEIIIIFLSIVWFYYLVSGKKSNIVKEFKNNKLFSITIIFIFWSFLYIFLPFFEIKTSSLLWFKYDTFFLIALLIWLYVPQIKSNLNILLISIFSSIFIILSIFLPWYIFWDISTISNIAWYSTEVSTYNANSCISFAQNVNGEHRLQASFGWPIRFSVFLVTFYIIFIWFISNKFSWAKRNSLILFASIFVITWVFFSYSKTSVLWLIFGIILYIFLVRKIIHHKTISKWMLIISWIIASIPVIIIWFIKRDLFLHLWSVLNRFENLNQSLEMFLYNPFWYWLWIAGPASQIWSSFWSTWWWEIATSSITWTYLFLPENWFVQILLELGIVWIFIFIYLMIIIWIKLYNVSKRKKDYLSIAIFVSFISLLFMANFTHAFEESATSYLLFIIIWWYLANKKQ